MHKLFRNATVCFSAVCLLSFCFSAFSVSTLCTKAHADGGMWLVNNIDPQLYALMKKAGLKMTPAQIYSGSSLNAAVGSKSNKPSLSNAVVALNGGECSGSIISAEGLMITNHHCAYSDIHALSTPQNNYLENGYWAKTRADEIPIEGKTVTFLRTVIDVTEECKPIVDSIDCHGGRGIRFLGKLQKILFKKMTQIDGQSVSELEKKYDFDLNSEWRGVKYYLYVYQTYKDIRFVGAPPVTVAAFGNDTDNWGWPQHKCDFAMYRVYAAPDGSPAAYSKENVPLRSPAHLTVSSAGVKEGDYTMVMGYPGSTNRYVSSYELGFHYEYENPLIYEIRKTKLDVLKKYMEKDPLLRLKYADEYFSISNYCDYAKWQNICIKNQGVIDTIKNRESMLAEWIKASPEREKEFGELFSDFSKIYSPEMNEINRNRTLLMEAITRACSPMVSAMRLFVLGERIKAGKTSKAVLSKDINGFLRMAISDLRHKNTETEKDVMIAMLRYTDKNADAKYMSPQLKQFLDENRNNLPEKLDELFSKSAFTDSTRARAFFNDDLTFEKIEAEPFYQFKDFVNSVELAGKVRSTYKEEEIIPATVSRRYVFATYEMLKEKGVAQAPDANSTMRITYGNVSDVRPKDGVRYSWQSTSDGILQKRDTSNYDFNMYPAVYKMIAEKDFGKWQSATAPVYAWTTTFSGNSLPVDFLSTNDITGGNSGSPVMNAKGELIGLAFDGNRDGMADEFYFSNQFCRCVNVDIRYVLWFLDKYAGEQKLISEMTIK